MERWTAAVARLRGATAGALALLAVLAASDAPAQSRLRVLATLPDLWAITRELVGDLGEVAFRPHRLLRVGRCLEVGCVVHRLSSPGVPLNLLPHLFRDNCRPSLLS